MEMLTTSDSATALQAIALVLAPFAAFRWMRSRSGVGRRQAAPGRQSETLYELLASHTPRITRRGMIMMALVAPALLFAAFIWPTPYRSVSLPAGMARADNGAVCCYGARVNRFSADVDVLTIAGWVPATDVAAFATR